MTEQKQILIADDEPNLRRVLRAQLSRDGYDVHAVGDGQAAAEVLAQHHIDVVITDLRMPQIDGIGVLKHILEAHPDVPVILITAHGTVDTAVEALKLGAFDYVTKPFDRIELARVVAKATKTRDLSYVSKAPTDARGRYRIIGQSELMQDVYGIIDRVADTPSTVLVTGESGTGKELIARALHEHSARKDKPFIRVNCAAIPPELLESELFGYERGAFTGAVTSKPGRFELANEGTLFLDEIGEISVSMQVKLLRVIQEQEFERVGGIKTIKVGVRLVAATNRDLKEEIEVGRFREDLYYRLNVVQMHLPPLRERRSDIPLLLEHFIDLFNDKLGRNVQGFSNEARDRLLEYPFRGNIRELENVVERCMIFCDHNEILKEHLPPEVTENTGTLSIKSLLQTAQHASEGTDLKEAVREAAARVERELILRALGQTGGNVTHTARLLKISRKSLQTKMKELGLRQE
ncbi:MAG: sigma-54 dependent transcriptional regulator [Myxococcota bacterium]